MKVKTLVILPAILVAMALVLPVSGYQYTFQSADDFDDFVGVGGSSLGSSATPYTDTIGMYVTTRYSGDVRHTISYPTTYWAFTLVDDGAGLTSAGINLYDVSSTAIGSYWGSSITVGARYEFIRSGTTIFCYKNGVNFPKS